MDIIILHLGTVSETIVATSVIKGILRQIAKPNITWVTPCETVNYILDYNRSINKVVTFKDLQQMDETYDVLINLTPEFPIDECPKLKARHALGFDFDTNLDFFKKCLNGNQNTKANLFQIYYCLSGMVWNGEGYDLNYFPKSHTKKNRIGIAVAHANIRNYVTEELKLENEKLWYIPYKKNIFKKMDEINQCKKIITDDITTLHLSLALHKYVYFLKTIPNNFEIELFNSGQSFDVPKNIIQEIY